MTVTDSGLRDALSVALSMARDAHHDGAGLTGYGIAVLRDPRGAVKLLTPFANLITDVGDDYYAAKAIVGIAPASPAAPAGVTGMQIGSGTTAVAKAGAGAAMVALLAGQALDAAFPQVGDLGPGNGQNAVYRATYAAGVGTGTVTEATLTTGPVATASTAANSIARTVFTAAIPKGANDSLAITWNHLFRGA